jgi:formate-dependent nitrite reductase membrane component NrfD
MKRWAILTAFLYALALILLSMPIYAVAFGNWGKNHNNDSSIGIHDILDFYSHWGYWFWLGILVAGQGLLLLLPVNLAERRPPARRPLKIPIIVTAFFLANLCFAGIFSILCAIFTDDAFNLFDASLLFHLGASQNGQNHNSGAGTIYTMIFTLLVFWAVWALVFFRHLAKSDAPDALLKRTARWLLRGSILELIIAVPSHVIVRRRDDCCAPIGTFWGITTGISVMLLCFGPGVFFLFVERCRRLQPKQTRVAAEKK